MTDTAHTDLYQQQLAQRERDEAPIRRDERHRIADLLERDGEQIAQFIKDPADTLRMLSYLLRLDAPAILDGTGQQ